MQSNQSRLLVALVSLAIMFTAATMIVKAEPDEDLLLCKQGWLTQNWSTVAVRCHSAANAFDHDIAVYMAEEESPDMAKSNGRTVQESAYGAAKGLLVESLYLGKSAYAYAKLDDREQGLVELHTAATLLRDAAKYAQKSGDAVLGGRILSTRAKFNNTTLFFKQSRSSVNSLLRT